jgi:hypothetical protein
MRFENNPGVAEQDKRRLTDNALLSAGSDQALLSKNTAFYDGYCVMDARNAYKELTEIGSLNNERTKTQETQRTDPGIGENRG